MKSISIYAITRKQNLMQLSRMERQLSKREKPLKMREWELDSLKNLVEQLEARMQDVCGLRFFYSFQIPRLGKEFDLLQIKEDQIINIELKSGAVSEEAMRRQLIQNRYYLSVLGRPIRSYTYLSSQNRLVRLTNHDHLADTEWEQLCSELQNESEDYKGDAETLFRAELFLISPLTEPSRFLKKEYFLTAQQRDIERQILKKIRQDKTGFFWFRGLPGTGKTLLLYDMAMKLSARQQVCMIHCGEAREQWKVLHERLRRVKYLSDSQILPAQNGAGQNGKVRNEAVRDRPDIAATKTDLEANLLANASAILVDEAHLLSREKLEYILQHCGNRSVIFSSDCEDMISPEEMERETVQALEQLSGIQGFRLTNRIRTNAELSSFIQNMMCIPERKTGRHFPHVTVLYANDDMEAEVLLNDAVHQGYNVILDGIGCYGSRVAQTATDFADASHSKSAKSAATTVSYGIFSSENAYPCTVTTGSLISADRLAIVLDQRYFYDRQGYLRSEDQSVRRLFHQLNGAKEELMLVVKQNEPVYTTLLDLL